MEDFDRLLTEVHRRGLKMILDFVPITPLINIPGFWKVDRHAKIRSG
jgi:glycosidase